MSGRLRLTYEMVQHETDIRSPITISFEVESSASNDAQREDVLEYMTPATGYCAYSFVEVIDDDQ